MRKEMAITKNVQRLLMAVRTLTDSPHGIERMGLLYGLSGEGKTTSVDHIIDKTDGIALRAKRCWTMTSMLAELCTELRAPEKIRRSNRGAVMVASVIEHLNANPRPLFLDEIDHLFVPHNHRNGANIMETIRDIYDSVKVPVILVGEENSAINIQENGRFARRITQWIEFKGIDLEDARIVADTVCEVGIADDLLSHLYQEAGANVGRIIVGIDAIERHGKALNLKEVNLAAWGDKPLFFDQPAFARKRVRK
jgi:hypothetical protein